MKPSLRLVIPSMAAALLLAATGCNSVPTQTNQYVGVQTFPPTNPAEVQILRMTPAKPHVRLGEITAEPASMSTPVPQIETKLQQAGAKLGANAVVIVVDRTQATGAVVTGGWYNRQVTPEIGRVIKGVAIRYTE